MKEIKLTRDQVTTVDDEDFDFLNQWRWRASWDPTCCSYKAVRTSTRKDDFIDKTIYMHRVIMNTPPDLETDHIDHDTLNNRKGNLRNCTGTQNKANKRLQKNNTSGYKGVSYNKQNNKWRVEIMRDNKKFFLGYFSDLITAANTYNNVALTLFGEFACINRIEKIISEARLGE